MVKKMSAAEFTAWRNLYTERLEHLRMKVIRTLRSAREGHIEDADAEKIVENINKEVRYIIECGIILNSLKNKK